MPTLPRLVIPSVALFLLTAAAMAERGEPEPVKPVVSGGIRYSAEGTGVDQYVVATDAATCNLLWKTRIFRNEISPLMETDVQWVFIKGLRLAGNFLYVTDERSSLYSLDLATQRVKDLSSDPAPGSSANPEASVCPPDETLPGLQIFTCFVGYSQGQAETKLAGVTVNRTTLSELKERIAAPVRFKSYPLPDAVSSMAWDQEGSHIYVSFTGQTARTVVVSGKPSARLKTGRGLALGQPVDDIERIYGPPLYQCDDCDSHIQQWKDGTELRIRASASGQVTSMELIASVH